MSGRPPPAKVSALAIALQREAKRQGVTGYGLAKASRLPLRTVQRFLNAEGSPTIATVEAIAHALGLSLRVEPIRPQGGQAR